MGRVHVRLNLEGETAEWLLVGGNCTADSFSWQRVRGMFDKGVQKLLDAECVNGAAKKDRGLLSGQICLLVKRMGGPFQQLDIVAQFLHLAPE